MSKFLKNLAGGVLVVGYAGLVGINVATGNWVVACSMVMAVTLFW